MTQISTSSFTAHTNTSEEMLNLLITVAGYGNKEAFASYMGVDASNLDENPIWAYNYLKDIIDANLTHLGYVMKDTRQEGMLGEYREAVLAFNQASLNNEALQQQFTIREEDIITEGGTLKISYLSNITNTVKNIS